MINFLEIVLNGIAVFENTRQGKTLLLELTFGFWYSFVFCTHLLAYKLGPGWFKKLFLELKPNTKHINTKLINRIVMLGFMIIFSNMLVSVTGFFAPFSREQFKRPYWILGESDGKFKSLESF